jgi:hypothetical protein
MNRKIIKICFAGLFVVLLAGWAAYSTTWATPPVSAEKAACKCDCGCSASGVCDCGKKGVVCPCKCGCGKSGVCNCGKKSAALGDCCKSGEQRGCCPLSE